MKRAEGENAQCLSYHCCEWARQLGEDRTRAGAVRLTLELLLDTGRLEDAQDVLDPEKGRAGDPAFVQQNRAAFVRRARAAREDDGAAPVPAGGLPPHASPAAPAPPAPG